MEHCGQTCWLAVLWVLQGARELICGANVEQVVRTALHTKDPGTRGVGEGLDPRGDIGLVAVGVGLELLAKVGVE